MSTIRGKIIREANKLFCEKGVLATSIQDIVKQSGISKGSFYNYFKSKEELTFQLIKQKKEELWQTIEEIENKQAFSERERFAKQLEAYLKHFFSNRELIQITFQNCQGYKELSQFLVKAHHQDLRWLSQQLIRLYGEQVKEYVIDCAALLGGMISAYCLHRLLNETDDMELDQFVQYILRRMDSIVTSFTADEHPLFTQEMMTRFIQSEQKEKIHLYENIRKVIDLLRKNLQNVHLGKQDYEKISDCLDLLENEFISIDQEPREYIIEGLLLYLEKQKLPGFAKKLDQLTNLIQARM